MMEACRFLHDGALMLIWGSAAYLGFLTPRGLADESWKRLGRAPLAAALLAFATTLVSLPLEAAMIGNGWPDSLDAGTLHDVLLESSVGMAWQAQAATDIVLLLAFATGPRHRMTAIAIGAALSIASLTLSGHASMNNGWFLAVHRGNDILHMLSGGAWLGALLPLILILRRLDDPGHHLKAQIAVRRFSTAGHLAVALVLVSGVVNTALVLGRWPTDWNSPYQRLLILKIAAVALMIGLAVANRYLFVPAIAADGPRAIRVIRIASMAEIAIGIVVIGLVAVFGMLDPV